MNEAVLLTHHPAIYLKVRKEYEGSFENILSLTEFIRSIFFSYCHHDVFILSSLEKLFLTESDVISIIQSLKQAKISPEALAPILNAFSKATPEKKDFLSKVLRSYTLYEKHKQELFDDEDVLRELKKVNFVKKNKQNLFSKIFILAHDLSEFEREFLESLSSQVEITTLSTQNQSLAQKIYFREASDMETEVAKILENISSAIDQHILPKNIYVYCFNMNRYANLFRAGFEKAKIPYSFWNESSDLHSVSVLPWHPNTFIFGNMKHVIFSGCQGAALEENILSEADKIIFHETVGKPIFMTRYGYREKIKQMLGWVAGQADHVYCFSAQSFSSAFLEYIQEQPDFQVEKIMSIRKERGNIPPPLIDIKMVHPDPVVLPEYFSARSLSQYQRCPYGFLLKECFGLRSLDRITDELTPAEEGELMHEVLWRYFSTHPPEKIGVRQYLEISLIGLERKKKKKIFEGDILRLEAQLSYFLKKEKDWRSKDDFKPFAFEWCFGSLPLYRDPRSVEKMLSIEHAGKKIMFQGKIDRIDIHEGEKKFRLIDYKTGALSGEELQLPLYAIAVADMFLPGYWPSEGVFYLIKSAERKQAFQFDTQVQWETYKESITEKIFSLYHQMMANEFKGTPHACHASCDLKSLCGRVI